VLLKYIALILLMPIYVGSVAAQPVRGGESQRTDQNALKTAILFGAASTKAAVDKADARIRQLYAQLETSAKRTRIELRRANLSDQERRRLQAELLNERNRQEMLLLQLSAKDAEYASSIRAYREGLTGLLADNDPRIVAAFERYADGDASALEDLQEVTRIIRKAREAGLKARNGADQRGVAQAFLDAKNKGQKTTRQALAAWREASEIDPSDFKQWIQIARLEVDTGNLAAATSAASTARNFIGEGRDAIIALNELGDIALRQVQRQEARKFYTDAYRIAVDLVKDAPSNDIAISDLNVSHNKMGDINFADGLLDEARQSYEQGLLLIRNISNKKPLDFSYTRAIIVSLNRVGDIALEQKRFREALTSYRESVIISRKLVEMEPTNDIARRSMIISLTKLGDFYYETKNFKEARKIFDETLLLEKKRFSTDKSSLRSKRDLSLALSRVGDVALIDKRISEALVAYQQSLNIDLEILQDSPEDNQAKRDVMVSYQNLGKISGDIYNYKKALEIAESMVRDGTLLPSDQNIIDELRLSLEPVDAPK
jgi:tetratricopeptide (TPR) repeat protein